MKLILEIKKNLFLIFLIVFSITFWKISDSYTLILDGIDKFMGIITPFIYAFIIAYILSPMVSFFDRLYGDRRIISIACVYAIIIAGFIIFINYFVPKLGNNIYEFTKSLPGIYRDINDMFIKISGDERFSVLSEVFGVSAHSIVDMFSENVISKITEYLQYISGYIFKITVGLTYQIVKWAIGFLVAIYILLYKESFKAFFRVTVLRMFGRRKTNKFFGFLENVNTMVGKYIGIKAVDSFIIGILALIGLSLLKSPLPLLLALVVGITNMIPYFGPLVGMVVVSGIHLFYSPKLAVTSLVFLFMLQQFDAWFLDPKLVGNKVGLNPFLIILAITIGGGYFGPVGMILSVPAMALIREYFLKFVKIQTRKNIEKRKNETNTEEKDIQME